MYNQSSVKFLNLSFIEKGNIDWNRIDKNVSFVTLHHPLLDRPVFLEYCTFLFASHFCFLLHCFDLPVTRSGRPRDRIAPFEWISLRQYVKIIAYRHRKLNYRIVIIIFSFFFFHQPTMRDLRVHAWFI